MGRIVVVGSSNVDLIMKVGRLPLPGESVSGGVFTQTYGGKGANQAVGAARSGSDVCFVSCLGADGFAPDFIKNFEKDGIDTQHVLQREGAVTGTALIMIDEQGENCISAAPGANNELKPEDIDRAEPALRDADMIVLQYEVHPDTVRHVIDRGAALGKKVLFNLAPAQALENQYLEKLHTLVVNESEAALLLQEPVSGLEDAPAAVDKLKESVNGCVILTLGAAGSYIADGDLRKLIPAFKVEAVDTTAAGDVYCGSLATALVEGKSILEAIRFASAASAITVTRLGAQPSAPSREEIDSFLSSAASLEAQ